MTTDTLIGLGVDTQTHTPWVGPAPTHGTWDWKLQMFSFAPTEGAQATSSDQTATIVASLRGVLARAPKARQPVGKGHVVKPAMQLACPKCRDDRVQVPVQAQLTSEGVFEAWFGKGECRCSACGYVGTQAKIRQLSMYDYTDLTQIRPEYGAQIVDNLEPRL